MCEILVSTFATQNFIDVELGCGLIMLLELNYKQKGKAARLAYSSPCL